MTQQIVKMGPCGGGGGNPRDMDDIRRVDRVVKVFLRHGDTIDAMTVKFYRDNLVEWTDQWGGTGGVLSEICLGPDEYFTSVEGHCGEFQGNVVVRSLTLVSNLRSYGPYGAQAGVPFALSAGGGKILGFHARSSDHLHALGTYVKAGETEGEENMAAWLVAKNTLKIMPFKLPPLGPHDVRVRMKAVGICGSDVHYLREMRIAHFVVCKPMVIGHECAGVVEELGSAVSHLSVGDRVALEPGISCWRCRHCKGGRYNLCDDMRFFATPPVHGSLANQVVHPADLCFKLPEGVTLEEGAMCEPLSVGVHACRRAGVGPETRVLVLGAGPIGLVTLLAARAFGAPRVVLVDVDDHRLAVAASLGADATVRVSTRDEDVGAEVERIRAAMGGADAVDVTMDCAGFGKTVSTALEATRPGGRVCLVGLGHNEMTVPLTSAAIREVDVVGIFRYKDTWPLCIEFLRSGKVDVKPLITHRFGFSQREVEEAFEVSARGRDAIKVMFNL